MTHQDFAHLHVHTEYSLLDGFSKTKTLVRAAKDLGMQHLAITDHGAMYGVWEFAQECHEVGLHPVFGVEAYLTENMADHSKRYGADYAHLLLLAENDTGYRNLLKLTTIAHTEGWHLRPRIDKQVLREYAGGLIATSACLSGEIPRLLLRGDTKAARKSAQWYQETFGPRHFYLELQDHGPALAKQSNVNELLVRLGRELHIPLVATNDLHYVHAEDATAQDMLLCIQTGKLIDAPKRLRLEGQDYYLKSPGAMWAQFGDVPDALTNTIVIAERCNVDLEGRRAVLPDFPVPSAYASQRDYLYALCMQGGQDRFGEISEAVKRQLDEEFSVIEEKEFISYFLIVGDVVRWTRAQGIRCLARGSAAGSLVSYVLGISNVDPLRHRLPSQRFLHRERMSLPDIDLDVPDQQRERVLAYVMQKYGADRVAQIVTFNRLAAKQSVRDTARVLGLQELGDHISSLIPKGPKVTLSKALQTGKELEALYRTNVQARRLIDHARTLEGSVRNTGVHAAGVVIANDALETLVPLQLRDQKAPQAGRVTQYEHQYLEKLGVIKFDFLGLSNLTILQTAVQFIRESRGEEIILDKIPLDETGNPEQDERRKRTFDLFASGETTGIFQLESPKMRDYIRQLGPTCIEDIVAMIALYRPGPIDSIPDFIAAKHGKKVVTYLDPRLKMWLEESYGVIVYQDQVLQIAVHVGGFSWGEADKFRKAMGKKIMADLEQYKGRFLQGCIANGMKQESAEQLYALILPFGGYGFNKAHAASYAVVAFHTAYLKANFPAEFMAATMTTEAADAKKIALDIAECRRLGVEVYSPDVNASELGFTVEHGGIRFGLLAIKGIGEGPIQEILQTRRVGGSFLDLADFCTRVDAGRVGKSTIETLIKAGAMDQFAGGQRHVLLEAIPRVVAFGRKQREALDLGQMSLFPDGEEGGGSLAFQLDPTARPIADELLLQWEKELLGVYVSQHPLASLSETFKRYTSYTTATITEALEGQSVVIGGKIVEVRTLITKRKQQMCVVTLEDMYGSLSITVFPEIYKQAQSLWVKDEIVLIRGGVQIFKDETKLICTKVKRLLSDRHIQIALTLTGSDEQAVERDLQRVQALFAVLQEHQGHDQYDLIVRNGEWQVRLTPQNNSVCYTSALQQCLEDILEQGAIEVQEQVQ